MTNEVRLDVLVMFYEDYLYDEYGIDARDSLNIGDIPDWYIDKYVSEAV